MTALIENTDPVCVVIPTFQRSDGLKAALESLFLSGLNDTIKILVVDNNPKDIEREPVRLMSEKFQHPINYVHESRPGVSNARNAAMANIGNARYLAFLDDDMCVSPKWLSGLIATSKQFEAGLVFGPTWAVMPDINDPQNRYMKPFFDRTVFKEEDGLMEETLGTGGCLLDLKYCQIPEPAFNPDLNESGGEDDIFFDHLKRTGTRVAWSTKAVSYEIVPYSRATPSYIWKRNFGFGQGPTRIHASRGLKGLPGIGYFMTTGAVQLPIYCVLLLFSNVIGAPRRIRYLAMTARALGKIFWFGNLRPKLYGQIQKSA